MWLCWTIVLNQAYGHVAMCVLYMFVNQRTYKYTYFWSVKGSNARVWSHFCPSPLFSTARGAWSCRPDCQTPHEQLLAVVFSGLFVSISFSKEVYVHVYIKIMRLGMTEGLFNLLQDQSHKWKTHHKISIRSGAESSNDPTGIRTWIASFLVQSPLWSTLASQECDDQCSE
jgi:hypothetical protein